MLKKISAIAAFTFFALSLGSAFAQNGRISGTVVDQTNSNTIPGANVLVTELGSGTATDQNGQFRITGISPGEYTLRVSFVGYNTKEVSVEVNANRTTNIRVRLVPAEVQLENVIVTALGIEREERALGYSVGAVDGADLENAGESNFISTLAGKSSGVNVTSSAQMGGSARIEIRGAGSISGDTQPLIIIDGVPIDNQSFNSNTQALGLGGYDYGNAASMINPSDIESISVLKGASAAALYGSRAANGVIRITTKDGSGEEGIGVTFQSALTVGDRYNLPDYQNQYGGGASPNFTRVNGQLRADYGTDQSWGPPLDGRMVREWFSFDSVNSNYEGVEGSLEGQLTPWNAHPNNVENYLQSSITSNTNIAFSQGGESYNYRLSLNNEQGRGSTPLSEMARRAFTVNGSIDLTDRFSASANGTFTTENFDRRPGSGYSNASGAWLQFNHFGQRQIDLSDDAPMQDIERPDGSQRSWNWANSTTAPAAGAIIYANNPYWIRRKNFQEDDTQRLYGQVQLSYDLLDNLTLTANTSTDFYTERRGERIAVSSVQQASYSEEVREVQETNVGARLSYDGQVTETVSLQATAGTEYRYNSLNSNLGSTNGGLASPGLYTLENSVTRPNITDYFQEKGVFGVYGDVSLGYNQLVYVGGSLRNDWSSTLPADQNSYLYPSVNASFVFSSLPALEDSDVLSFGKVRANWSQVGRDTDPYQLSFTYPFGQPFNGRPVKSLPSNLPNPNLQREIKTSFEIGTQVELFRNRVSLDATYYQNETEDLIQEVDVSRASGYGSRLLNAGRISNKGVELQLGLTPVTTEQVTWDLTFNWSKNVNKVEELAEGIDNLPLGGASTPPFGPEIVAREGEPLGTFWGNGFVRDEESGQKVVSPAGFYASEGPKVLGDYRPDWTGSVSTTVSVGNVTASVLVDGQKGGQIWSLSNLFGLYSGIFQESAVNNIREVGLLPQNVVTPDGEPFYGLGGTEQNPTSAFGPAKNVFQTLFGNHEAHLYDADFIKLREASISYTLPRQWFEGFPIQQFRVSAVGRNLATLLKYTPNFDPTAITTTSDIRQGFETGQLPPNRTLGFRVNVQF